jgi:hypothetical protein
LYSGDSMFRLMQTRKRYTPSLFADPRFDPHTFVEAPHWDGTVVGIDLSIERGVEFSALLEEIRSAYFSDVNRKKDYAAKIRFS